MVKGDHLSRYGRLMILHSYQVDDRPRQYQLTQFACLFASAINAVRKLEGWSSEEAIARQRALVARAGFGSRGSSMDDVIRLLGPMLRHTRLEVHRWATLDTLIRRVAHGDGVVLGIAPELGCNVGHAVELVGGSALAGLDWCPGAAGESGRALLNEPILVCDPWRGADRIPLVASRAYVRRRFEAAGSLALIAVAVP